MSIMDQFRQAFGGGSAPNPQQPQQQLPGATPGQPGNLPQQQPSMSANSPDGQMPGNLPQKEVSPFAEFEKLWDTPKTPEGHVPDAPIAFNIDQAKVQQSVKAIDFTKTITPGLLEKINAGGEGATQAMLQAMNEMAQTVMAQTMMANTKVLETGLETSYQRTQKNLPTTIRKQTIGAALREDNPLFNNPATAPMLQMLETQLVNQFPNASTAEIKEHARKYLVSFADAANNLKPEVQEANQFADRRGKELDWSTVPIQ